MPDRSGVMYLKVKVKSLSCERLFATPWTVAYQAPPSMGFSKEVFPTQGLNPGLPHCRQMPYCLSHQGILRHSKKRNVNQEMFSHFPESGWISLLPQLLRAYKLNDNTI